jgi:hypothetical protein
MVAKPVTIGRWSFRTKGAAEKMISDTLQRQSIGVPLSGDDLEFILANLDLHPGREEKLSGGCHAIVVRKNHHGNHTERCFYIVRDDGSEIDFGAYRLFDKSPTWTLQKRLNSAARHAVGDSIKRHKLRYFAEGDTATCEITGRTITWDEADVHHAGAWTFKRILDVWLEGRSTIPDVVDVNGVQPTFKPDDAEAFVAFHDARAILQIVHKSSH